MYTYRLRPAVWFATGVVLTLIAALTITQAWSVDAAPGDTDSTVVAVDPPVRILDTRSGQDVGLTGPFVSPTGQKLQVTGSVPTTAGTQIVVPDGSTGVLLNVTAVRPTGDGFVSVRPGNASGIPATSNLNVVAGDNVPNAVTVALPTSGSNIGQIDITYVSGATAGPSTEMLVDVVGFLTDESLDEIAERLDALEADTGGIDTYSAVATATAGPDEATARAAAPEIPLATFGGIELYGKCFFDNVALTLYGTVYARTSIDGAIMEGSDDRPDFNGVGYLDTGTLEIDREVDDASVFSPDLADISEAESFIIEADGTYTNLLTGISLKRAGAPAGNGPFGPGNACILSGTVIR